MFDPFARGCGHDSPKLMALGLCDGGPLMHWLILAGACVLLAVVFVVLNEIMRSIGTRARKPRCPRRRAPDENRQ